MELHIKVHDGTRITINGKDYHLPNVPSLTAEDKVLVAVAAHLGYEPAHVLNLDWDTIDRENIGQ